VDRSKTLVEEPATGHNRWHPDIAPIVRCEPGDEVVLETRDAFDGQMGPQATLDTVAAPNLDVVHPLTGPVYVEGAEPGDLLEVEIVEVVPDSYGYTVQVPGFGFLRDVFPDPYMVRWTIADGWATSEDLPSVRIPGAPFMGTIGLSPGREALRRITAREKAALERGGFVLPPSPASAVPSDPAIAAEALRTIPPGSRRATSTSSNSPPIPGCSFRWTRRGRCSPPATRTSPRATARRVARRSR
jgi:formamidase